MYCAEWFLGVLTKCLIFRYYTFLKLVCHVIRTYAVNLLYPTGGDYTVEVTGSVREDGIIEMVTIYNEILKSP